MIEDMNSRVRGEPCDRLSAFIALSILSVPILPRGPLFRRQTRSPGVAGGIGGKLMMFVVALNRPGRGTTAIIGSR